MYWQERLEKYIPFEAEVENGFESAKFQKGEKVQVVGITWIDESNGLMVECHGREHQSDFPLTHLHAFTNPALVDEIINYKRYAPFY